MDEALLQQLVAMGAIPEEQAMLLRQADQGQAMMQTPSAAGMHVGATYKAASPLEHLSVALQRVMGGLQQNKAQRGYQDTLGKQTEGRSAFAQALMAALGKKPEPVTEMPPMWIGSP